MQFLVTLLLTAVMAAHAGLGCCAHHEHVTTETATGCHDHACHGHHADSDSDSDEPAPPESCDENPCVYVTQESSSLAALDCFAIVTPLVTITESSSSLLAAAHRAACEDVLHPAGPALHLWQCVLVI